MKSKTPLLVMLSLTWQSCRVVRIAAIPSLVRRTGANLPIRASDGAADRAESGHDRNRVGHNDDGPRLLMIRGTAQEVPTRVNMVLNWQDATPVD
jgi:hypothetical protein